jgi:hypothetical protein
MLETLSRLQNLVEGAANTNKPEVKGWLRLRTWFFLWTKLWLADPSSFSL